MEPSVEGAHRGQGALRKAATERSRAAVWNDPHTPQRERKRMARLLITDVTLLKSTELRAQLRFKGGATSIIAWSSRLRTSRPMVALGSGSGGLRARRRFALVRPDVELIEDLPLRKLPHEI
jgi:hypothetical protein